MEKSLAALIVLSGWLAICPGGRAQTSAPRLYHDKIDPHWLTETDGASRRFWYQVALPGERQEFVFVDAEKGERNPAFDHVRVAAALSRLLGKTVDPQALPVRSISFAPDARSVTLHGPDAAWTVDLGTYDLTPAAPSSDQEHRLQARHTPHPSPAGGEETSIHFVNRLPREVELFWLDAEGQRQSYGSVPPGGEQEQHTYAQHVWLVAEKDGTVIAVFQAADRPGLAVVDGSERNSQGVAADSPSESATSPARSPDRQWEVTVENDNLILHGGDLHAATPLTRDARPGDSYACNFEAARAIGMDYAVHDPARPTPEVYWSPDSRRFVAMRYRAGTRRRVDFVRSSPADQLQPRLESYPYLKPGDDIPFAKPHLFDTATRKEIPLDDTLFANPYEIDGVRWNPDGSEFTFQYNRRGHQVYRVLAVSAATGAVRAAIEETSRTFICYCLHLYVRHLERTGEILWMSERDGWNHLYLYDAKTGAVKNQVTRGSWAVRGVDDVDEDKRQVWFHAGGVNPAENPYNVHYYRVNFDGTGLTALTGGDGTHAVAYSPDHRFLIDSWSRVDQPPINQLRRADDGKLLCRLEEADASELRAGGWQPPEPFTAKGRDGTTDIYGVIRRPRHFDPDKKYPVIEDIYAGPTEAYAPVDFSVRHDLQELADLGFVIVQINGMGTPGRSKAFHDVCWKNLADAGFPDRVPWMRAAAATRPFMDLTRVGIVGSSAGGQNAMRALLDHGDFYKVAVADSGCHDNRMDKLWWNEQWMGWPVDDSYAHCSNVVDAHKLQGKLLLLVGEDDRNVDPSSTMQVVNALVKADKDFELFVMPNMGHGVISSPYGRRRMTDFLSRHLLDSSKP